MTPRDAASTSRIGETACTARDQAQIVDEYTQQTFAGVAGRGRSDCAARVRLAAASGQIMHRCRRTPRARAASAKSHAPPETKRTQPPNAYCECIRAAPGAEDAYPQHAVLGGSAKRTRRKSGTLSSCASSNNARRSRKQTRAVIKCISAPYWSGAARGGRKTHVRETRSLLLI